MNRNSSTCDIRLSVRKISFNHRNNVCSGWIGPFRGCRREDLCYNIYKSILFYFCLSSVDELEYPDVDVTRANVITFLPFIQLTDLFEEQNSINRLSLNKTRVPRAYNLRTSKIISLVMGTDFVSLRSRTQFWFPCTYTCNHFLITNLSIEDLGYLRTAFKIRLLTAK